MRTTLTFNRSARPRGHYCLPIAIALAFLANNSGEGHDYLGYLSWSDAALAQDLKLIASDTMGPQGYPINHFSSVVGLTYAIPSVLTGATVPLSVTGFFIACMFWAAISFIYYQDFWRSGDRKGASIGVLITFLGTHASVYTLAHSSESLSLAVYAWLYALSSCLASPAMHVALCSLGGGFLFAIRPQSVFLTPILFWRSWKSSRAGHTSSLSQPWWLLAGTAGLVMVFFVKQAPSALMFGSFFESPYLKQASGIPFVDLWDADLFAVLFHPFHGLFSYHPLYFLSLVAPLISLRVRVLRPINLLHLASVFTATWFVAALPIWYGGDASFGLRYLCLLSVPLPHWLMTAIRNQSTPVWLRRSILLVAAACCLWTVIVLQFPDFKTHDWGTVWRYVHRVAVKPGVWVWLLISVVSAVRAAPRNTEQSDQNTVVPERSILIFLALLGLGFVLFRGISPLWVAGALLFLYLTPTLYKRISPVWLERAGLLRRFGKSFGPVGLGLIALLAINSILATLMLRILMGSTPFSSENQTARTFKYSGVVQVEHYLGDYNYLSKYLAADPSFDRARTFFGYACRVLTGPDCAKSQSTP